MTVFRVLFGVYCVLCLLIGFSYHPSAHQEYPECAKTPALQNFTSNKALPTSEAKANVDGNNKEKNNNQIANEIACSSLKSQWHSTDAAERTFWITVLGIGLVGFTLYETIRVGREVNRQTEFARLSFEAETRPILLPNNDMQFFDMNLEDVVLPNGNVVSGKFLMFDFSFFNYGNGVSTILEMRYSSEIIGYDKIVEGITLGDNVSDTISTTPPKSRSGIFKIFISESELKKVHAQKARVVAGYHIVYCSIPENPNRYELSGFVEIVFQGMLDNGTGILGPNYVTKSLPTKKAQKERQQEMGKFRQS